MAVIPMLQFANNKTTKMSNSNTEKMLVIMLMTKATPAVLDVLRQKPVTL